MLSVTETCRDINELKPSAQQAIELLFQECFKVGIKDIFVTETYRSQERQSYLYQQGRTRPGNQVTWTLNSNHTPRLAWDIAVAPPKNLYDTTTLNKVGAIAKKLGIEWGGYWKAPSYDAPHFQVSSNWKIPKGYALEGTVVIPTNSKNKIQFTPNGNNSDWAKKVGYNAPKDTSNVWRIHTSSYPSKKHAELAQKDLVTNGYLAYAEVFGNDTDGYRVQSGKYISQKAAEQACKKLIENNKTSYCSIIGTKE